jgi:hypothetical protein
MKRLATLVIAMLLGVSLSFAQASGGGTGDKTDTAKTDTAKGKKGGKKGKKGGKKSKKGASTEAPAQPAK